MAATEDDEEGDIDEGFLHDTPWHAKRMADVFANFATVGNLVLVADNALSECILNKVDLFDRSFVKVVFLEGFKAFIGSRNIIEKLAFDSCTIQADICPCHPIVGVPVVMSNWLDIRIRNNGGSRFNLLDVIA